MGLLLFKSLKFDDNLRLYDHRGILKLNYFSSLTFRNLFFLLLLAFEPDMGFFRFCLFSMS